jgi:hypothetical protein
MLSKGTRAQTSTLPAIQRQLLLYLGCHYPRHRRQVPELLERRHKRNRLQLRAHKLQGRK